MWTGQRQADRLSLIGVGLQDGRRVFRKAKTKAIVAFPQAPVLDARLEASRLRRTAWPVQPLTIVVDERQRLPFKADRYRHVFMAVRAEAAKGCASLAERARTRISRYRRHVARQGRLQPVRDLCHHGPFALVRRADPQALSGQPPELADNAIAKLVTWFEGQAT